uniref:WSN domain-containing protein n=1 Tax=Caenorhabditis tropicalis TaxID=1561998 RepID=A0A1I7UDP2_9PELO
MRFFFFCIFLFDVFYIESNEDDISVIHQIFNEVSDVHQTAQDLFLESQLVNGKKSPMELAEELLNTTINVTLFEEYVEMDIGKIKELKKPKQMSEEDEIKVIKAFQPLRKYVSFENVLEAAKSIIDKATVIRYREGTVYKRFKEHFEYIGSRLDIFKSFSLGELKDEEAVKTALQEAKNMILELDEVIEKPTKIEFDSENHLVDFVNKTDSLVTLGIKPLVTAPLADMESALKYVEEFRDSQGFVLLKKIQDTVYQIDEFEVSQDVILKYQNIKEVQTGEQMGARKTSFRKLEIKFFHLKSCIKSYGYPMRFDKAANHIQFLVHGLAGLNRLYVIPDLWETFKSNQFIQNILKTEDESLITEESMESVEEARNLIEMIVTNTSGEAYTEFYRTTSIQAYSEIMNAIGGDLEKVETLLKCHSEVDLTMDDVKKLVVLAEKVLSLDLMKYVDFFKEIHEKMIEIKDWRIESDQKTFPLDEEEIKGISDGLKVLKHLKKIDDFMEKWADPNALEEEWISVNSTFGNETFETVSSSLAYLQDEISRIHKKHGFFAEYPSRLQKMREGVEKYERWMEEQTCLLDGQKKCNNIPDEIMKHVEL